MYNSNTLPRKFYIHIRCITNQASAFICMTVIQCPMMCLDTDLNVSLMNSSSLMTNLAQSINFDAIVAPRAVTDAVILLQAFNVRKLVESSCLAGRHDQLLME